MIWNNISREGGTCLSLQCRTRKPIHILNVVPSLPGPLSGLRRLAYNLRWTWDHDSIELFRRLDSELWESTGHDPVRMLGSMDQAQLEAAVQDETILIHVERTVSELDEYLASRATWYQRTYGKLDGMRVAYFSAEFGLTECLSIFEVSIDRLIEFPSFGSDADQAT